jgi:lipopolysaccharide transport protein LptA
MGLPRALGAALAAWALPYFVFAAATTPLVSEDEDFRYSFDTSEVDFRSDTAELSGNVRVLQGLNLIEAQKATVNDFRSENSQWHFREEVRIRTAEAELKSALADATFKDEQLIGARAEGSPAQFESVNATDTTLARGRARLIEYDVSNETVKLSGDVWFGYGKDEFRGDTIIYYLRDERVVVNPPGEPSGRVRGIIRPKSRPDNSASPSPPRSPNADERASGSRLSSESGA